MESHLPRFQFQLCYLVMWPWISHLTSLSVSSLEELEGTEKRKNKVFHLSLYCVTNPQFGLKQHFIIISHSSIGCLGSAGQVSCGASGAAVIWRLGTQDGSSNAWYLMLVHLWQLSWGLLTWEPIWGLSMWYELMTVWWVCSLRKCPRKEHFKGLRQKHQGFLWSSLRNPRMSLLLCLLGQASH